MLSKDGQEAIIMRRLNKVNHLVNDHVFEKVLRLGHELRIEADVPCLVVAASPLGFHPLKKILSYPDVQPHLLFF